MKSFISLLAVLILISASIIKPQEKNKSVFAEPKPGFYQEIKKGID
ncbi:MAG: hypothetical protein H6Q27_403, partial [Ignavibacteriaceae bacterium]|nr:hypothetical protein [Ignavibacteriaceae bacterium]